jgi:integrase/recombinase XerD
VNFFTYAQRYVSSLEIAGKIGTHKRAKSVVEKFHKFWGTSPLPFKELNFSLLKQYEQYLLSDVGNKSSTLGANMKMIRTIYNNAVKEDLISLADTPFTKSKYQIRATNPQREFLTENEIKLIEELPLKPDTMLFHHRNMYSVYMLVAYGSLML